MRETAHASRVSDWMQQLGFQYVVGLQAGPGLSLHMSMWDLNDVIERIEE